MPLPERRRPHLWLGLPALLWAASAAGSTAPSTAPSSPAECQGRPIASERLACYDAIFPPTARPVSANEFGLSASQRLARRGEAPIDGERTGITASIASVQVLADGDTLVTLDSGAQWRVTERAGPGTLRAGRAVRIRPAALGTFLLTPEGGRALRAKRVR